MRELAHRYAAAVDDRRFDDVAELFAEDGVLVTARPPRALDPVDRHVGREAVRHAFAALDAVPLTFHALVGEQYDGTRGRIACVAHHVTGGADGPRDTVWHLRYLDDYVETGDGWRFALREVHVDLVETRRLQAARLPLTP